MSPAENAAGVLNRQVTRRTFLAVAGALASAACIDSTTPEPSTPPEPTSTAFIPAPRALTENDLREAAKDIIEEANTLNRKFEDYPVTQNRGPLLEETRLYLLKKYRFYYS